MNPSNFKNPGVILGVWVVLLGAVLSPFRGMTSPNLIWEICNTGNIEYDRSYKTGVFDQYDNPVAMLTKSAVYDLFFDNFSDRYGY